MGPAWREARTSAIEPPRGAGRPARPRTGRPFAVAGKPLSNDGFVENRVEIASFFFATILWKLLESRRLKGMALP